jgi:hypothetical protein
MARKTTGMPADRRTRKGRRTVTNASTSAAEIRRAERRALATELRRSGLSYERIAEQVRQRYPETKYDRSAAYQDVRRVLDDLLNEHAPYVLAEELSRLNAMTASIWTQVRRGDLQAIDRMIKIMERRAAYLGLDSPVQHQLFGPGGGPVQVADVTDPDEVFKVAMSALTAMAAEFEERRAPRELPGTVVIDPEQP